MTAVAPLPVVTDDGVRLQAEWSAGSDGRAAVVLCHPHPQFGGSMRAHLVGELFRRLVATGAPVARFNFRGVERSGGAWSDGVGERLDVAATGAALRAAVAETTGRAPALVLVGWSFGADLALTVRTADVLGWVALAPPLRWVDGTAAVAEDPRPKHVLVGARDDLVTPELVTGTTKTWRSTTVEVVPDADHFFTVGTDAVVDRVVVRVGELGGRGS